MERCCNPNRFEIALGQSWHKLYIDGNLAKPELSDRLQDVTDTPVLSGEVFGVPIKFQRVNNPHSGCFFLNARQMQHWSERPEFLNRDPSFAGPLESAATLGIMHFFRAYKPARENAGFLEVRHLDNRYLGARLKNQALSKPVAKTTSRLSSSAPIHGPIFSSSVPGKKPMSSPTDTVARVMMISV